MKEQTIRGSQVTELEQEVKTLKDENSTLNKKIQELSSVEAELKKAEDKAQRLERRMEDMVAEKVAQKESELNATYDERIRNYEERFVE